MGKQPRVGVRGWGLRALLVAFLVLASGGAWVAGRAGGMVRLRAAPRSRATTGAAPAGTGTTPAAAPTPTPSKMPGMGH